MIYLSNFPQLIIIKSKTRIILFVSTNVTLKYTFLNSFNHNEATFHRSFIILPLFPSIYMQNCYIRINFANTLLIKFFKTGRKTMMRPQTVGFLATIKLSSNDRFLSTSTNTITKISKGWPTN